ncbi:polysaccharide deacetylase family protein [Ruegeria sp. HKCCD8929]|uniref:polysaccharide deacetylase family protein n=1 Tax=Ruegeria sp. HKCCD8929 TaxID=2683006 RepID=UPI0014899423|nr:polysaccharide deacetylase family protein [Ruegeria sp. HKCCD8929]
MPKPSFLQPNYESVASKRVWITLDDGPHPRRTPKILRALAAHKVKATFFVIGQNAKAHPDIIKAIHDQGHGIANHTYTHPDLTRLSLTSIRRELSRAKKLTEPYEGKSPLFRPPYGASNANVELAARELGYRLILWNVDTLDWNKRYKPDGWIQHGIDQIRNRSSNVVLAHDIQKTTADHFSMFLTRIKALGSITFEPPSTL